MHECALHVAELDVAVLARRCGKDFRRSNLVPLALESGSTHLAEEQVAQDNEGPGAHVRSGLEAFARSPCLEQRLLHQVIGQIAAAGERAPKRAQVWDYRCKLLLEFR